MLYNCLHVYFVFLFKGNNSRSSERLIFDQLLSNRTVLNEGTDDELVKHRLFSIFYHMLHVYSHLESC